MGLNRSNIDQLKKGDIALVGFPFDAHSSFMTGPAKAPELIIDAIECDSANYFTESLIDLNEHPRIAWCGNAVLDDYFSIAKTTRQVLQQGAIPFSLGGDHSITYPILQSIHEHHGKVNILHFDAHTDLYDELDHNKFSHACPFARIMEEGLAKSLTQIGIRTLTQHTKEQAERFGVKMIQMKDWVPQTKLEIDGPVYISFDLDVLDQAFAPGLSHHEPGGFSTREVLDIIQRLKLDIIGLDLVEYNPDRDVNGMTAMVAAKITKELIDRIL